jgi:D123
LTALDIFVTREYEREKETCLILMPYIMNIDKSNEFRIFVVNNKLTAASPQYWFIHTQYSCEELEAFEEALNNIPFIDSVPYNTFVADVYINVGTKECHLIELNPFGAQSGAGASFFNWHTDYDILYGKTDKDPELRYLSAISF